MRKSIALFGPPGTGKTSELIKMCAKIPSTWRHNLFLSFTKAAALEAISRLGPDAPVKASTLHSLAYNAVGASPAQVVDAKKLRQFGNAAGFAFKGSESGSEELQEGDELAAVVSYANNTKSDIESAWDFMGRPSTLDRLRAYSKAYAEWRFEYGFIDFDDMLMMAIKSKSLPRIQRGIVMLDEAQDCSPLQWELFHQVIKSTNTAVIAGDDDQAIYEWNGADPHGMIKFTDSTSGELRVLGVSYRLPRQVYAQVCAISDMIDVRVPKKWRFKPGAIEGSVTRYGDIQNVNMDVLDAAGGALVLVRDRFRLDEMKRSLNQQMIPYEVYGGHSPWTSAVAKKIKDAGGIPAGMIVPIQWMEFYHQALRHRDLYRPVRIILSTIHQAKGREHDTVVVDLEMSPRTLLGVQQHRDAELRVMYVACSRAKKDLLLCGTNPLI